MINTVCDVDSRTIPKVQKSVAAITGQAPPKGEGDVRKLMHDKDIDAIYIEIEPQCGGV